MPLIAQATTHLGIVPTISTSFYPPFLLARLIATLDLMSKGRVGCNFVTSTAERAAQNFGLDAHLEHDLRYEMARSELGTGGVPEDAALRTIWAGLESEGRARVAGRGRSAMWRRVRVSLTAPTGAIGLSLPRCPNLA